MTDSHLDRSAEAPTLDLSVVVPTHNRVDLLPGLLASLANQEYPAGRWEVVLVADGCSDGTESFLESGKGARPANTRWIVGPQSGAAAARNRGARVARGRALLFLDDDMVAHPRLVAEHAAVHLADERAVAVGHMVLPAVGREPWVAWEDRQIERHYSKLESGARIPGPRDLYSGNTSFSSALFTGLAGFDETLPRTEDVELGYRAHAAGAHFYYRNGAASLHLGKHSYASWLRTASLYGRCDVALAWEKGHTALQSEIFRWFHLRHGAARTLVRMCVAFPALARPVFAGFHLAGRLAYRAGARGVSGACYSAIYNTAYWMGVAEALGQQAFWDGVRRHIGPERPPAGSGFEAGTNVGARELNEARSGVSET